MGQASFSVVGQHDQVVQVEQALELLEMRRQDLGDGCAFEIDPRNLLAPPDHAQLHRSGQRCVHVQVIADLGLAQQPRHRTPRLVVTDYAQKPGPSAQRGDVAGHVGGATEALFGRCNSHDRHRRLGRNAFDLAEPVAIQHHVSDDQHVNTAQAGEIDRRAAFQIEGRFLSCRHRHRG